MTIARRMLASLFFLVALGKTTTLAAQPENGDAVALNAVAHEACGRQIVMIGESATHGDGHTEAFKVALVEKLVNQCGFNSVFFEASHYEFINIARQFRLNKAVTADQVSSAVGGLWRFDQEFKPLVPFLLKKAIGGQIYLGGVDDQLGQFGQEFSNVTLPANLTMVLPEPESQECNDTLHRRIYGERSSQADGPKALACLDHIRRYYAANVSKDRVSNDEWLEMIDAAQRWIERESLPPGDQIVARDRSMFQDFQWLIQQRPKRRKVIIWMATVHAAKKGDPTWGDQTGSNFGSLLSHQYGARAFSLGFSALGGTYRQGRETHDQPPAPTDSLEVQAFRGTKAEAVFIGPSQLSSFGAAPAAIFRHNYQTLPWSDYVDGVVIFRQEHAPTSDKRP